MEVHNAAEFFMSLSCMSFRQKICWLFVCSNEVDANGSIVKKTSAEVVGNVHMFGAFVVLSILQQANGTDIV